MNAYEASNRTRKALALADTLRQMARRTGASVDDIEHLPSEAWETVAVISGVRHPSEATRAMVIELLRHDPVCGLGSNGLSCQLPVGHVDPLHDWEDAAHVERVEAFLDEQDRLREQERRAS